MTHGGWDGGVTGTIALVASIASCVEQGARTIDPADLPEIVDFNFHVKPILSDRCFKCHGPDASARQAELRFDREEDAFAQLALGPRPRHPAG